MEMVRSSIAVLGSFGSPSLVNAGPQLVHLHRQRSDGKQRRSGIGGKHACAGVHIMCVSSCGVFSLMVLRVSVPSDDLMFMVRT